MYWSGGGDFAAAGQVGRGRPFSSSVSSTAFGPRGTASILSKITIGAAAAFMLIALMLSLPGVTGSHSVLQSTKPEATPTPASQPSPAATARQRRRRRAHLPLRKRFSGSHAEVIVTADLRASVACNANVEFAPWQTTRLQHLLSDNLSRSGGTGRRARLRGV